jgi:hypothetical protein
MCAAGYHSLPPAVVDVSSHGLVPPAPAVQGASPEAQLAVLLRMVQWHLDEVAHNLPAGRATMAEREDLADMLEDLAGFVRASPTRESTTPRDEQEESV